MKVSRLDVSIAEELFPSSLQKGQRRKIEIVQAAIRHYARSGIEGATFERIARTCKIGRTLVLHYFKDREELFTFSMKFVRGTLHRMITERVAREANARAKLQAYVQANFAWGLEHPDHCKAWLLFFYRSATGKAHRQTHAELVDIGHERITALIELGVAEGVFRCPGPSLTAKMVQVLITGALVSVTLETDLARADQIRQQALVDILAWVEPSAA
jgi:AcrR family transcriptional regulator